MSDALDDILIHDPECPTYHVDSNDCNCNYPRTKAALQDLFYKEVMELIGPDHPEGLQRHIGIDKWKENKWKASLRAKAAAKWSKV